MTDGAAKLVCKSLWKIFGPDADGFFGRSGANPGMDAIREAGLIPAVRDVNLSVAEGEIFVIMGLSGSGKSTLVRCLSRWSNRPAAKSCSTAAIC